MNAAEPLGLLLGGYFGPDWRDRYETWERAVDVFAGENEIHLAATIDACEQALTSSNDDAEVQRALEAAGSTYQPPPDETYGEWLGQVAERLRSHIS